MVDWIWRSAKGKRKKKDVFFQLDRQREVYNGEPWGDPMRNANTQQENAFRRSNDRLRTGNPLTPLEPSSSRFREIVRV